MFFLQNTPLHDAANKGYVEIVNILMENGADPNLKNAKEVIYFCKSSKMFVNQFISTKIVKSTSKVGELYVKVQSLLRVGCDR